MVKCPSCKHDVSDSETKCPNCGEHVVTRASVTMNDVVQGEGYKSYKIFVAIVILALVLFFLLRM